METKRILIADLFKGFEKLGGTFVTVSGWIRTARDSKAFGFLEINDGSAFRCVQAVLAADRTEGFAEAVKLPTGAAVTVTGTLLLTPENKQPFEISADSVTLEGGCDADYPMQKKRHSLEFLRENAYLRPRTNTFNAVFKVRSACAFAIHKFFHERNFVYVHTPIVTGSDCEGAGAMFRVTALDFDNAPKAEGKTDFSKDFFGKSSFLTVSGQLNVEPFALAFSNVYTFGPTFRAERSNTARHAAEFWMIEPEIAFADLNDDMRLAEAMVKYIVSYVLETCPDEMDFFNRLIAPGLFDKLENVLNNDFAVLTYEEGVKILEKVTDQTFEFPVFFGCDLQSEHERYITEKVFKKPVFLINYPKEIKAFYMRQNDDNRTVAAMDLFVPGIGELIGGSQREERQDVLKARIAEMKLNEEDYTWYTALRRFGGCKHAGYGLGFERMIMYLTGMSNIRDVIPYPRTVDNLEY